MLNAHHYAVSVAWEGNRGTGTSGYREYGRQHTVTAEAKHPIAGSADPTFRGDPSRWNPEEMLLAALSQCHMLSYLHSAVTHGITVVEYTDSAIGTMEQSGNGGHFTSVTLRPRITISHGDPELALSINEEASRNCFIAASVNFPVGHEPLIIVL